MNATGLHVSTEELQSCYTDEGGMCDSRGLRLVVQLIRLRLSPPATSPIIFREIQLTSKIIIEHAHRSNSRGCNHKPIAISGLCASHLLRFLRLPVPLQPPFAVALGEFVAREKLERLLSLTSYSTRVRRPPAGSRKARQVLASSENRRSGNSGGGRPAECVDCPCGGEVMPKFCTTTSW